MMAFIFLKSYVSRGNVKLYKQAASHQNSLGFALNLVARVRDQCRILCATYQPEHSERISRLGVHACFIAIPLLLLYIHTHCVWVSKTIPSYTSNIVCVRGCVYVCECLCIPAHTCVCVLAISSSEHRYCSHCAELHLYLHQSSFCVQPQRTRVHSVDKERQIIKGRFSGQNISPLDSPKACT